MSEQEGNADDHGNERKNSNSSPMTSKKSGWDGKLRVQKTAVLANPEALSDPEYSDEDAPPVEEIKADEGNLIYGISVAQAW